MKRARRIAHEVAEASRATVQGKKPRDPRELVATARTLERLLARRRKLRRELRLLDGQIKHERKMLKALAGVEFSDDKLDTPMPVAASAHDELAAITKGMSARQRARAFKAYARRQKRAEA